MNRVVQVARKDLWAFFDSSVAVAFLGAFLASVLFIFFTWSGWFARGIADLRPLFEWMPLLLILLVSAITMRAWAEERQLGTLEILLTLPIKTHELVLGKFIAGMMLVFVALLLTTPIAIVASQVGPLDWGPVIGGYAGAFGLAGAYMALGLCVSSRTDNQVVALMVTLMLGGLLYVIGAQRFTGLFSTDNAELLRLVGTGSRFESISRGVLDVRDLAYYFGLTTFFLTLNGFFLEMPRIDRSTDSGRSRLGMMLGAVLLVGANTIALNLWLQPVTSARIDLTEAGDYSISEATDDTLGQLVEPLYIDAYFTERTHPLLAPLVPQLRDLLVEYEVRGKGRVVLSITDPTPDMDLQEDIGQSYGIRSVPFGVNERNTQSVINAFFHVLVRYGDQYEVLSFQDLIEIDAGTESVDIRLRNPEYDLTRAIKRVSQDFQPIEAVMAGLPDGATLTLYASANAPDSFDETLTRMDDVAKRIAGKSVKLPYARKDPAADMEMQKLLVQELKVKPLAADIFQQNLFWAHLVLQAGDMNQIIRPKGDLTEADIQQSLESAIKRVSPGSLTSVGILTEIPVAPPPPPNQRPGTPPPQAPPPDFNSMGRMLQQTYAVDRVDVSQGDVPDRIDVLVVGNTGPIGEKGRFAIDQFLMRGGTVVALAGRYGLDKTSQQGMALTEYDPTLHDLLALWGVEVPKALVMDPQNTKFPVPVNEKRGRFTVQRVELIPFPFFVDVRRTGFLAERHPSLSGLSNVTLPFASPLEVNEALEGLSFTKLLQTTPDTWRQTDLTVQPNMTRWPGMGYGNPSGTTASEVVAVAVDGTFTSWYAANDAPKATDFPTPLTSSVDGANLVVLGSAEMLGDFIINMAQSPSGEVHRANLNLLQNLVDWSQEDTSLLSIRTPGAFARTLDPLTDEQMRNWEYATIAAVFIPLLFALILPRVRRSRTTRLAGLDAAKGVSS